MDHVTLGILLLDIGVRDGSRYIRNFTVGQRGA